MSNLETKFSLDQSQKKHFLRYFNSLPKPSSTTFIVFDHGEFYSAHGQNAIFAAKKIFKSISTVQYIGKGDEKIETVYLSPLNFESLARDVLLVHQYKIEIHQKQKVGTQWSITYKASPGNLTQVEDIIFKNYEARTISSRILAVKHITSSTGSTSLRELSYRVLTPEIHHSRIFHMKNCNPTKLWGDNSSGSRKIGIGFINATSRELSLAEFEDNEVFSNLESAIIQLGVKECLLLKPDQSSESNKLVEVLKRIGILMTYRNKKDFESKELFQDVEKLLKKNKKSGELINSGVVKEISEKAIAAPCLAACVKYLELVNNEDNFEQFSYSAYNLFQFMRLDRSAYSALNLFPSDNVESALGGLQKSTDSLFGLLDHCKTSQGRRLLSQWIKQPLVDSNHVQERLDLVEIFVSDTNLRLQIADEHLQKFPDFFKMSKKFYRKKASLQDCYRIYQALRSIPLICECLTKVEHEHSDHLKEFFVCPLHELAIDFKKFSEMVELTLDFDKMGQHEFRVKADFDEQLMDLQDRMNDVMTKMESCFDKAARDLSLDKGKSIKLESNSQYGYFFRVTCKEEKNLRNKKQFFTIDTTKAGVRFVTDALKDLSESYQEYQKQYEEQQSAIVNEIIGVAAGYCEAMVRLSTIIAKLDVLVSFAQASAHAPIPYVKPEICAIGERAGIELKECRHPCLERQLDVAFIANSVSFDERRVFHIITGPNMGGKSTFMRQTGIAVLMAQLGCFVPCTEARITLVDAILARVGAGDCQVQGVSTFMSEMLETSSILHSATRNSLVIIDELGRGTSTYDGFGLAWAISHHIATQIEAYCMFATHFHELTELADEVPAVANFHVTALTNENSDMAVDDGNTLTMLYQVKPGVCDRSFGIHVAECVNFPKHVTLMAKRKAEELETYFKCSFGNEDETDRKKRRIKKEGEEIIINILSEAKAVNWSSLAEDEAKITIETLRKKVNSFDNPYITSILAKNNQEGMWQKFQTGDF